MIVIGLTGGVGAGKDEAARVFKKMGAVIINADEVGHRLLEKSTPVYQKIVKLFGLGILNPDGEIDRRKLGKIVFGNRRKLKLLDRIIHPLMEKEFRRKLIEYRNKGVKTVVLNAAVLFEAGWDKLVKRTILITAPEELRIKRLQERGIDRKKAIAIIFSQWSDARRKKKTDFIIENDGSIARLKKRITDLWQVLLQSVVRRFSMFTQAKRLQVLPPYLFAKLDKMKSEAIKKGVDVISFGIGDPDIPTPRHIIKALQKASENSENHRYPSYEGMLSFRQAVAKWHRKRFGVRLNPEDEVLSLIGAKEGIGHIPLAFINPGDVVFVPEPAYPVYRIGTIFAGGMPYMMPLLEENSFLPDFSKIPSKILRRAKMMFINYPNNPTAAIAPKSFLKDTVRFAKKNNIIVCYDNTYSEMTFDGYKAPSILQVPGAKDVCVEYNSLSKTYNMTGWRIAWACGNREIIAGLGKIKTNLDSGVFQAIQEAAVTALSSSQECVKKNLKILQERRDILVSGLKKLGWKVNLPKATFYVWTCPPRVAFALPECLLSVRKQRGARKLSSVQMCEKLLSDCGILATPGVGFGPSGESYLRFALTVDKKRIREAIDRMRRKL
ncbi:hypothetical protein COY51_03675 [Candidatus Desantisbacteria bacterium CG_4_10_14_0_8_um_filter_39_17]|nr:MAG: hypothetical protein COY51_03675 [Candidatus Desantisbacteria bacterium CG_4_10_14_0_8_um_filter_39_17]